MSRAREPKRTELAQPRNPAPPKIAKRDNQIAGQAMRRPMAEAAALDGGFLSFAGVREHYMAQEPDKGRFVIRHIETGKEVAISGVDYIQFADLTVSCEFLTRSNPDNMVLPTPAVAPPGQGNIHELAKDVAAAIDEGLLSGSSSPSGASSPGRREEPPAEGGARETIELGPAIEEALAAEARGETPSGAGSGDAPGAEPLRESGAAGLGAITITEAELLAGAGDDAALTLKITDITCKGKGDLQNNANGSWTFLPGEDFAGEIELQLIVVDGSG